MSHRQVIVLSPIHFIKKESAIINDLFEGGLFRYHLVKKDATEQGLAEILQGINSKFLSKITLHSHYHLVLAYGVGGIHFEENIRIELGDDFIPKVDLYQGFGIQVSSTYQNHLDHLSALNYVLSRAADFKLNDKALFHLTTLENLSSNAIALLPEIWNSESLGQVKTTIVNSI